MQTVLIVIHLMVVVALVVVVLLQRSEGGALGVGGGSGFMTGRGQANVLTRATAVLATIFFITSLSLTILANYGHGNRSILEGTQPSTTNQQPATLPPKQSDSVLDQLRQIEKQRAGTPGEAPKAPDAGKAPTAGAPPAAPAPQAPAATNATPAKPAPAEPTGVPTKPADDVTKPKSDAPKSDTTKSDTPAK